MNNYLILFKRYRAYYRNLWAYGIVSILIGILILFLITGGKNKIKETYESKLAGRITSKIEYQGALWIRLNQEKHRYLLDNSENYNLEERKLKDFLTLEDSIYKPANTDSLYIYRNGKCYLFMLGNLTFNKNR